MDIIDRSAIPDIHAAARRHRAVYLNCLLARLGSVVKGMLHIRGAHRTVPCA